MRPITGRSRIYHGGRAVGDTNLQYGHLLAKMSAKMKRIAPPPTLTLRGDGESRGHVVAVSDTYRDDYPIDSLSQEEISTTCYQPCEFV